MRTVAWLRAELAKFPDDALCFAYEGEVIGIVITPASGSAGTPSAQQGCIYCSEDDDYDTNHTTELLACGPELTPAQATADQLCAAIAMELDGIDREETDEPPGWWETSSGAESGAKNLAAVLALVRTAMQ